MSDAKYHKRQGSATQGVARSANKIAPSTYRKRSNLREVPVLAPETRRRPDFCIRSCTTQSAIDRYHLQPNLMDWSPVLDRLAQVIALRNWPKTSTFWLFGRLFASSSRPFRVRGKIPWLPTSRHNQSRKACLTFKDRQGKLSTLAQRLRSDIRQQRHQTTATSQHAEEVSPRIPSTYLIPISYTLDLDLTDRIRLTYPPPNPHR
jgi:hypothetical protein